MLSGIGPRAASASRMGIAVQAAPRRRRRQLSRPPGAAVAHGNARHHLLRPVAGAPLPRAVWNLAANICVARRGPLASNVFESTAFIRSEPGCRPPGPADRVPAGAPQSQRRFRCRWAMASPCSVVNLYPRSRGAVRLASATRAMPRGSIRTCSAILRTSQPLLRGLQLARRLCVRRAFAPLPGHRSAPRPQLCRRCRRSRPICARRRHRASSGGHLPHGHR